MPPQCTYMCRLTFFDIRTACNRAHVHVCGHMYVPNDVHVQVCTNMCARGIASACKLMLDLNICIRFTYTSTVHTCTCMYWL